MKIKDLKVNKKFIFSSKKVDASFYVIEEENNKYDTIYFGFIQVVNYRGWHYFTKSQINYISRYFSIIEKTSNKDISSEVGDNKLKGLACSFSQAKKDKIYFNSSIFFVFYNEYFSKKMSEGKDLFKNDYYLQTKKSFVVKLKKERVLSEIFSDRIPVIFNEKSYYRPFFHLSHVKIYDDNFEFLKKFKSKKELIDYLIPEKLVDKKSMIKFLSSYLIYSEKSKYENYTSINFKLISACLLVNKIVKKEVVDFNFYKKLLISFYKKPACFKREIRNPYKAEGETGDSFIQLLEYMAGDSLKNKLKVLRHWKFYSSNHYSVIRNIEKIRKEYPVDFSRHKDPFWAYNFYSKKYTEKNISNFEFENQIEPTKIKGVSIIPVIDLKNLISIGVKLHNCAGNIENLKDYKKAINFIVEKEGKSYLGTVKYDILTQLKGWKNSAPSRDIFDIVSNFLLDKKLIKNKGEYNQTCIQDYG